MSVRQAIKDVTDRIATRSAESRAAYLDRVAAAKEAGVNRSVLSCGNLAHGFAACSPSDKARLAGNKALNLGIVNAYNDMLSAHQPYQFYPDIIKAAAHDIGATAQVAGGVPAMCDGVTQGSLAWICRCFRATSLPWRRRSLSATTCTTPRYTSASATRSCPAC